MANLQHSLLPLGSIHRFHNWEYADATTRLAATGFTTDDVGRIALDLDTMRIFMLTDESPITWVDMTATGPTGPAGPNHVTTKGDIETFSTVPDRLPVGSNGKVLQAASSEATGLKWVAPGEVAGVLTMPRISGRLYGHESTYPGDKGSGTLTADQLYCMPFLVYETESYDLVAAQVVTQQSGANWRLGIYADDGNGAPDALIQDFGTVSAATTGYKSIAISPALSLDPGIYWLAIVTGTAGTVITSITNSNGGSDINVLGLTAGSILASDSSARRVQKAFTYAALPNPAGTLATYAGTAWRIMLRKA